MLKLRISSSLVCLAALLAAGPAVARQIAIPFNPGDFSHPLNINNIYFPLVPGTTFTYKAAIPGGCSVDVMTVTNQTRVIDNVTTRAVHDQVFEGPTCTTAPSALAEDTTDYYAQDNAGNVWYMGEDTFTCQGAGHCTPAEGGWIAGVNGAQPGIIMLAQPRSGDTYRQEYAPGVAEDQATVTAVGVTAKMTRPDAYRRVYTNCIVTKEFTALAPGDVEYKTYCPNVGLVQTVEHQGNVTEELVSITHQQQQPAVRPLLRPF